MRNHFYQLKYLLLGITTLLLSLNTNAQDKSDDIYRGALTFGLVHSFNLTSVVGSFPDLNTSSIKQETSISSPRFTLDIGMTADYYINKMLSVQIDAVYTYNGAHFVSTRTIYNEVGKIENSEWFTYATSYFKFPLAMVFYPKEQLYFSGGAYLAPLMSARKYNYWYDGSSATLKNVQSLDYGMVFGMGFNLKYLKVGFQYSYGIGSMIDDDNYDLHHSDFQLVARWKFMSDVRKRKSTF